jgi:hypothetical protein
MPQGARVLRREQRHAWRGISGGRRTTHRVVTTYGRGQELAAHIERWKAWRAAALRDGIAAEVPEPDSSEGSER